MSNWTREFVSFGLGHEITWHEYFYPVSYPVLLVSQCHTPFFYKCVEEFSYDYV